VKREFTVPADSLKRLVLAIGLSWIISPAIAWAGFELSTFQAGPNGGAQVEGFVSDNKSAYTSTPDQLVSNSVEGSSGIEGEDFANYFAQMTYLVPSTGGSLSVSGDWVFQTDLITRTANIGAGLLFDSYLYITAGESFEISGTMRNAGITFRDPDGQDVFPFTSNYFSGTEDAVSLSGTLAKSGIYRLNMTSSMFTSGSPEFNAHRFGGYDLVFSVSPTSTVPEPSTLALFGFGAIGLAIGAARRRQKQSGAG
jgi:hypothetical protein